MLETKRLILKTHTLENVEKMNKWGNDPQLLYYDDDGPEDFEPTPIENTRKYIKRIIEEPDDTMVRFGIHKKDDQCPIGFCMIAFIDDYNKSCKIGMTIGEKEQWGKGYGKEALIELIRYSFEDLGMNRIGAEIFQFNKRSIKLFEQCGFQREGVERELVYKDGKFKDQYIYGLLRREYKS